MNKNKITGLVTTLASLDYIIPIQNTAFRMVQENVSLKKCLARKGYLALYDTAIRYSILILLLSGYDIKPGKVHLAFKTVLKSLCGISSIMVETIIQDRHRLKHDGLKHHDESSKTLLNAKEELARLEVSLSNSNVHLNY